MRKLIIGLVILIVLLIAAVLIVPSLVPSSVYKEQIETQLTKALDRDVKIDGEVKLSVFPSLSAKTEGVTIANPEGFKDQNFASMDGLEAKVKLIPLFSKRVEIAAFKLKNPQINLEKTTNGQANWVIGDATSEPSDSGPFKRDGRYTDIDAAIGLFSIEDGSIRYSDLEAGQTHNLTEVNVAFSLPSLSDKVEIDGDLIYNQKPVNLALSLDTPNDFLNGLATPLTINLKTNFADISAKGSFIESQDIGFDLNIDGEISDLNAISEYLPEDQPITEIANSVYLKGDYSYDGAILTAKNANVIAKGDLLDVVFNGDAKLSDTPVLDGNIDLDIRNPSKLASLLEQNITGIDLINSVSLKADMNAAGDGFTANDINANILGDGLDASFNGSGTFIGEDITANGRFNANAASIPNLVQALALDIPQAKVIGDATLAGTVDMKGDAINVVLEKGATNGPNLNADYQGRIDKIGDEISANGRFNANVVSVPNLVAALDLDLPQAAAIGNAELAGTIAMNDDSFNVVLDKGATDGPYLTANYQGTIDKIGENVSARGDFDANFHSITELAKLEKIDIPYANAIEKLRLSGQVDHNGSETKLTGLSVNSDGGIITGQYNGDATIADMMAFNGNFNTAVRSVAEFSSATGTEIPYSDAIGKIAASGNIAGAGERITVTNLDANLSEGQLNGRFEGRAAMAGGFNVDGNLSSDIPSLRALAATTGTQLPPNTDAGAIYERLNISGVVSGNPEAISFKQARIAFDDINGTGDLSVDMTGAKPFMTGLLNLDGLDLRPYMASYATQNPTGEIQPWSEEPLNLSMLNSIDGDIDFKTPNIITDRMNMGEAIIDAQIRNGKLTAVIPNIDLYGGLGSMTTTLDASGSVPAVAMNVKMTDLTTNKFLAAVAGFTTVSGEGATLLDIKGQGLSQAAIMRSLNGAGDFKLVNGQIAGVDLGEFMTGLDQAFTSRRLPSGIGSQYSTKFNDIIGLFKVENGVAKIDKFTLQGFGVAAEGHGQIDLGNQNIDFSLRPRLTGSSASNLASFGIPIKLQGGFGNVSAGLDTDFLGKIAAEQAKARAAKEITNRVGGPVGNILGGLIGGGNSPQTTTGSPEGSSSGQPSTSDQTSSTNQTEDLVNNVLGGLLGGGKTTSEAETTGAENPPAEQKEEPKLEDALLDLFGGKKK